MKPNGKFIDGKRWKGKRITLLCNSKGNFWAESLFICVCVCGGLCARKTYKAGTQYELSMFVLERMENSIGKNSLKKVLNEESAKRTQILLNEPQ